MKDYIVNILERRLSTRMKNREEILEGFDVAGDTLIKAGYEFEGSTIKDLVHNLKENPNMSKKGVVEIIESITYAYFTAHIDLKNFINSGGSPSKQIH